MRESEITIDEQMVSIGLVFRRKFRPNRHVLNGDSMACWCLENRNYTAFAIAMLNDRFKPSWTPIYSFISYLSSNSGRCRVISSRGSNISGPTCCKFWIVKNERAWCFDYEVIEFLDLRNFLVLESVNKRIQSKLHSNKSAIQYILET